jgi:hypothetical protein
MKKTILITLTLACITSNLMGVVYHTLCEYNQKTEKITAGLQISQTTDKGAENFIPELKKTYTEHNNKNIPDNFIVVQGEKCRLDVLNQAKLICLQENVEPKFFKTFEETYPQGEIPKKYKTINKGHQDTDCEKFNEMMPEGKKFKKSK